MNRAERRRNQKSKKTTVATYNLTNKQLNTAIERSISEKLNEIRENATIDAIDTSMSLMLVLPMKVLMEKYWSRDLDLLNKFADDLFELYGEWMNGGLDLNVEKEKIWETAGIKFVVDEEEVE